MQEIQKQLRDAKEKTMEQKNAFTTEKNELVAKHGKEKAELRQEMRAEYEKKAREISEADMASHEIEVNSLKDQKQSLNAQLTAVQARLRTAQDERDEKIQKVKEEARAEQKESDEKLITSLEEQIRVLSVNETAKIAALTSLQCDVGDIKANTTPKEKSSYRIGVEGERTFEEIVSEAFGGYYEGFHLEDVHKLPNQGDSRISKFLLTSKTIPETLTLPKRETRL